VVGAAVAAVAALAGDIAAGARLSRPGPDAFRNSSGSLAILAAIRRALAGCTLGVASTKMRCMAEVHGRVDPMDDDYGVISQAESDEGILAFDVSKRTASTEQQAFTWIYCTGAWQYCPA
jgi:hypothetical protein